MNHVQSIQQINGHPSPLRHVKSEERLNDDGSTSSASSPGCGNRGGEVSLPVTTSMTNLSLKQVADMDCWSTEDDELTLQYPGKCAIIFCYYFKKIRENDLDFFFFQKKNFRCPQKFSKRPRYHLYDVCRFDRQFPRLFEWRRTRV